MLITMDIYIPLNSEFYNFLFINCAVNMNSFLIHDSIISGPFLILTQTAPRSLTLTNSDVLNAAFVGWCISFVFK